MMTINIKNEKNDCGKYLGLSVSSYSAVSRQIANKLTCPKYHVKTNWLLRISKINQMQQLGTTAFFIP